MHNDETGRIPLPHSLNSGGVCGVGSFNIFDEEYWREIIALDIPSVFIDTFYQAYLFAGKTDIITPENAHAILLLLQPEVARLLRFAQGGRGSR